MENEPVLKYPDEPEVGLARTLYHFIVRLYRFVTSMINAPIPDNDVSDNRTTPSESTYGYCTIPIAFVL